MSQVPWRRSVKQHPDEAIGSLVIRLAPEGLLTPGEFLKYHFGRDERRPPTDIASDREALEDLAVIGSFNVEWLYQATWKTLGTVTEFLGRRLPQGWLKPEVRRLAPGILCADSDDPWVRNEWQIRALPCDCDTGEMIIERCAKCREGLTWIRTQNVYSCAICGYDQRAAKARYAPADVLARSRDLRAYLRGDTADLPAELASLEDYEFLSLICWLTYFVALPDCVLVRPSPHEAVTGFRLAKQWPNSFDKTVDELLTRYGGNPDVVDHFWRVQVFEEALVALGRVGSQAAQTILEARLISRLRLPAGFNESKLGFIEPVARFDSRCQRFKWASPSEIDAMRSSHDRTRLRPPSSSE